ncbi:MAG: hypothetical protein ACOCWQ_03025 [Nanoarchaeota archaeon]
MASDPLRGAQLEHQVRSAVSALEERKERIEKILRTMPKAYKVHLTLVARKERALNDYERALSRGGPDPESLKNAAVMDLRHNLEYEKEFMDRIVRGLDGARKELKEVKKDFKRWGMKHEVVDVFSFLIAAVGVVEDNLGRVRRRMDVEERFVSGGDVDFAHLKRLWDEERGYEATALRKIDQTKLAHVQKLSTRLLHAPAGAAVGAFAGGVFGAFFGMVMSHAGANDEVILRVMGFCAATGAIFAGVAGFLFVFCEWDQDRVGKRGYIQMIR